MMKETTKCSGDTSDKGLSKENKLSFHFDQ